jgi:2-phospho-L-lactate guanylyltransferase
MNAALVPVRALSSSKGRLGDALDTREREALTRAMLEDMITALAESSAVQRTIVVSADPAVLSAAAAFGAEVLPEVEGAAQGLNAAVTTAARQLAASGVRRLLVIPGDCPLIEAAEVDVAFAVDPAAFPVVLIPSGAGSGTNGLLLSPPDVIEPRFEGESLAAHRRACDERGVEPFLLALESFRLDVDTPADLRELMLRGGHRRSGRAVARARHAAA